MEPRFACAVKARCAAWSRPCLPRGSALEFRHESSRRHLPTSASLCLWCNLLLGFAILQNGFHDVVDRVGNSLGGNVEVIRENGKGDMVSKIRSRVAGESLHPTQGSGFCEYSSLGHQVLESVRERSINAGNGQCAA